MCQRNPGGVCISQLHQIVIPVVYMGQTADSEFAANVMEQSINIRPFRIQPRTAFGNPSGALCRISAVLLPRSRIGFYSGFQQKFRHGNGRLRGQTADNLQRGRIPGDHDQVKIILNFACLIHRCRLPGVYILQFKSGFLFICIQVLSSRRCLCRAGIIKIFLLKYSIFLPSAFLKTEHAAVFPNGISPYTEAGFLPYLSRQCFRMVLVVPDSAAREFIILMFSAVNQCQPSVRHPYDRPG